MLRIVSSLKKHIILIEFWRVMSFVCKRALNIAKILTKLPLSFAFILYILHLIRAGLRVFNFFKKTKNKNSGETLKLIFALFKVLIAVIALCLLASGYSIPAILLSAFLSYNILKFINSAIILPFSLVSYLKIDKNCIEKQWVRAQYRDNVTKHVCMLSSGFLFVLLTCLFTAGAAGLVWVNPVFMLLMLIAAAAVIGSGIYFIYVAIKHQRISSEYPELKAAQTAKIKRFLLLFGLGLLSLILIALSPFLGFFAVSLALILLNAQDAMLSIYYYFWGVKIPDPMPSNLDAKNALVQNNSFNYYRCSPPILYLKTGDVLANKIMLIKVALVKLLQLENKLQILSRKTGILSRFFSGQKKLIIKKKCLLQELAWTLNFNIYYKEYDKKDVKQYMVKLFIEAIIGLYENRQELLEQQQNTGKILNLKTQKNIGNVACLEENLAELLDTDTADYFAENRNPNLKKNLLFKLFFISENQSLSEEKLNNKPKQFYQSFWTKTSDSEYLSQAFRSARTIEKNLIGTKIPSSA